MNHNTPYEMIYIYRSFFLPCPYFLYTKVCRMQKTPPYFLNNRNVCTPQERLCSFSSNGVVWTHGQVSYFGLKGMHFLHIVLRIHKYETLKILLSCLSQLRRVFKDEISYWRCFYSFQLIIHSY